MSVSVSDGELRAILQNARRARGVSLTALATASGVHKSTLSRWESGKSVPFIHELTRVMDALDLTPQQRQTLYQKIEAPRAVQAARADAGAANVAISTGELLRALRLRAGVTQTEAGRAAGVSRVQIGHWENGGGVPADSQLHALCFAYRVTDDEMVFLTTRGWRDIAPLPRDKAALDQIVGYLEFHDPSPHRFGAYLALAARYQALYRAGKISQEEAVRIYGHYGYWVLWRMEQPHLARQIAAPALEAFLRSRETTGWLQSDILNLAVEYSLAVGRVDEAIAVLQKAAERIDPDIQDLWFDCAALTAEKAGNIDQAIRYYDKSIASVHSDGVFFRRKRKRALLIRQGRFSEAVPLLALAPPSETRSAIIADNLMEHAVVLGALGEKAEAERYYSRARALSQKYDLDLKIPGT